MKITYLGHSSFLVQINQFTLLFDPFISPNPLASKIPLDTLKPDYILVSHGHYDHIADAVVIAKQSDAKIIASYEIISYLEKQGVKNGHSMNLGGSHLFEFGKVKCVNAVHSSSLPDGSYGGNPMGFLIESGEGNFYFAGDTALSYDMKLIGEYKTINFAFLPIGGNYTMDADNAIIASNFINCDEIIGMHYDTFEVIKINHEVCINKFKSAGKKLILPQIGESFDR